MQVLMLERPKAFLAERRKHGGDQWDEVWNGVLHVVPQPTSWHQEFGGLLEEVLRRISREYGWFVGRDVSLYDPDRPTRDFRVPDLVIAPRPNVTTRGIEGPAKLVVEILSPNDESRAKLPYYAVRGVEEIWLVDRELRAVEVLVLRDGGYVESLPIDGVTPTDVLGVTLETVSGPRLRIAWSGGVVDV